MPLASKPRLLPQPSLLGGLLTAARSNRSLSLSQGFDRLQCSGGLNAFGAGNYFARNASLAASYAPELLDAADADRRPCKAIFLCALMHDELTLGEKGRFPPPRKPHSPSGAAYSATAGPPSARDGERDVIVTYADGQAIPLYIVCLEA